MCDSLHHCFHLGNYNQVKTGEKYFRSNVFSPWRDLIPSNRTCEETLIPEEYCVCHERIKIDTNIIIVKDASNALINHLNTILPLNECHKLTLESILNAEVFVFNFNQF